MFTNKVCIKCGDEMSVCKARLLRLCGLDNFKLHELLKEHGHVKSFNFDEVKGNSPNEPLEESKPVYQEPPKQDKVESRPIKITPKKKRDMLYTYVLSVRISKKQKELLEIEAKENDYWFTIQAVVRGLIDKHLKGY